jgi:hypothetical protein
LEVLVAVKRSVFGGKKGGREETVVDEVIRVEAGQGK